MKKIASFLVLALLLGTNALMAQNAKDFIGNWESKDKDGYGKYKIFEKDGAVLALMYYWKDKKEEFSLEKEMKKYESMGWEGIDKLDTKTILTYFKDFLVLTDFKPKGGKWKGQIIYDEKGSKVDGTLKSLNKNELSVSYSYYGYSEDSIWKRIK
jgi:hypothetical protein